MSELTNKIIENITSTEDFSKVLRDVAVALKSKGFFDNSNWCDELIQNFKDVIDVKVTDDNNTSCITDNEHEISCSFIVDNTSKFNAKSKTSTTNPTGCQSITNDNMFDDSNDSFEIPETQPFPPTDHPNGDEHDSEGFVIMPDDGFVADISSQSQVLLQGTELGVQSPQPPEFDDSDTVDMEMSKLQWDDSAKDNDKNKSASVTPELDFDFLTKQATIRNVDIKPVNKANADLEPVTTETADPKPVTTETADPKPVTIPDHHSTVENDDPDFETQDLDFEPTLAKSVFEVLDSPQTSTLSKVSSSLGRNKLTKNSPVCKTGKYSTLAAPTNSKCGDGEELGIEKIDNRQPSANGKGVELKDEKSQRDGKLQLAGDAQTSQSDKIAKEDESAGDAQTTENSRAAEDDSPAVEKGQETAEEEQTKRSEHNEPVENLNECDDELPETQFFIKSGDDTENRTDVEVPEDQLFKKPTGSVVGETDKPKRVSDAINDDADNDDAIENLDETQLFFKPNASSTEEDDAYDVETQLLDVVGPNDQNQVSLAENGADNDGNNKVNVINVDVAHDKDFDEPRPKLRKRNRLIESSDEEEDATDKIDHEAATQKFVTRKMVAKKDGADAANRVDPNANDDHTHRVGADGADEEDDADDYEAQTQKFETKKPETPRRKRISALKGSEWDQLCDTANTNQANAVFKSVFDQCKDLRKVHGNDVSVASVANQSVAAEASTRQSSRSRVKVKHEESNDAEPIASKRQRIRLEPIIFKAPSDSKAKDSTKASAKADTKSREVKASKDSTKTKSDAPPAEVKTSKDSSKISSKSDAPPPEVKTSKDSSKASTKSNAPEVKVSKDSLKASLASSKQDETDENIDLNMPHTQVFVKASSTPKERTKPDLPQRQARAATTNQKLLKPKDVQPLTRAVRQSVTYSPKVANVNVKVSSDENENVDVKDNVFANAKPKENDKQNSDNFPRLTRKRKAIESNDSSVKRQASDSNDSVASSSTSSRSPSLSRSTRNQNYSVMFTMVDPAPHKAILKKLNISIVAETDKCNALITDKMYRTSKFMCAVAAGKPIVSIEWINAMRERKSMIDPFEYLLKDAAGEKKYHFKLAKTLDNVRKNGGLYQNYSVLVTPGTSPSPDILKDIIASSGGKYLKTSLSARKNDSVLCVSAEEDEKLVTQLKKKYANLKEMTAEQFMQSIFQYKI